MGEIKTIRLKKNTYDNILFLKAQLEGANSKILSFDEALNILTGFLIKKIENDDFEDELITFSKNALGEGEGENDR